MLTTGTGGQAHKQKSGIKGGIYPQKVRDTMNREEARNYILARATDYLQRDNSGKGWLCPICGSGSGSKGTGLTSKDGNRHFTCWAGCFTNSDIIDIIGKQYHLTDYNEKLQKAADIFHITIESGYTNRSSAREDFAPEYQNQPKIEQPTQQNTHNNTYTTTQQQPEPDYTDFFLQANKDIEKTDYHRGLSLETLNRFKVGYAAEWKHPKAPKMKPSPRLIIPTSRHSYLARHASEKDFINFRGVVENKSKVGRVRIFNSKALREAQKPIFITEGEIDAMSVVEAGGEAVALGSASEGNVRRLLNLLEKQKPTQPLILAIDNDKAGDRATAQLIEGLERLGVTFYKADISHPYKDPNEALNADREAFTEVVRQAEAIEAETLEAEREAIKKEAVAYSLQSFIKDIEDSKRAAFIPTGFGSLDNLLDGGLYAGLYVVGALSSLGKTSFCLQVADNIAQRGHEVLIFSLEMAKNELVAKSISRLTLIKDLEKYQTTAHAKTTRGILTGSRYKYYSDTEKALIQEAVTDYYQQGAENLFITEGVGDIGIEEVKAKVKSYIKAGIKPTVLIDYLQILAPADVRATDKQNTDKAVLELKRLSRDYNIPVIVISSFNRENYTTPVNMTSFKESGAVEYSSDVLIGLQLDGMDYRDGEKDGNRQKRIRKLIKEAEQKGRTGQAQNIQVKILKNRNGSKGDTVIEFYPMFNYFTETQEGAKKNNDEWDEAESSYSE